jgi:hypothetical protein
MHVGHQKQEVMEMVEVDEMAGLRDFLGDKTGSSVSA